MRKYRNQILAGLLFITVVLIAVVVITGASAMTDRLERFPLWLLVPVLLLKVVNWALRYIEWRYFLGVIGVKTVLHSPTRKAPPMIHERDSIVLYMAGLSMVVSPGKLAEVLKALVLKNMTGTDFARGVPVVFMERLVDGLAVIILITASLLFISDSLDTGDVSLTYVRAVLIGTSAALVAGILLVQVRPLMLWLLGQVGGWPLIGRLQAPLLTLYESSYDLLKLRHLLIATTLGMGAYFSDSVGFYLLLRGLDVPGSSLLLGQATFILGFSVIVASLSTMPGGAGGRELTVGAMLTGVVGLAKAEAGTATFLISLFQVWVGVLVGLVIIALFRRTLFPPSLEAEIAAYESAQAAR